MIYRMIGVLAFLAMSGSAAQAQNVPAVDATMSSYTRTQMGMTGIGLEVTGAYDVGATNTLNRITVLVGTIVGGNFVKGNGEIERVVGMAANNPNGRYTYNFPGTYGAGNYAVEVRVYRNSKLVGFPAPVEVAKAPSNQVVIP